MANKVKETIIAHSSPIKILFLAANPSDTTRLRLDREMKAIDQALRQAAFRDRFAIEQHWAVSVSDLQGLLLRHQPDIVHFSGHGSRSGDIILEQGSRGDEGARDATRELQLVGTTRSSQAGHASPRALSRVFGVLKDNIRCVLLNACYSEDQAQAIAEHIDCVIGMTTAIGDEAAISFAAAFYQALGYGRSVQAAFDLGCAQIDLDNLEEQDTPKLLALRSKPAEIYLLGDHEVTTASKATNPDEFAHWQRRLKNARENLSLIEERIGEYINITDVPLELIRNQRRIKAEIEELESKLKAMPNTPGARDE